jgi:hypothetical protein
MNNELKHLLTGLIVVAGLLQLFVGLHIGNVAYILSAILYAITFGLYIWEKTNIVFVILSFLVFLVIKNNSVAGLNPFDILNILPFLYNFYITKKYGI